LIGRGLPGVPPGLTNSPRVFPGGTEKKRHTSKTGIDKFGPGREKDAGFEIRLQVGTNKGFGHPIGPGKTALWGDGKCGPHPLLPSRARARLPPNTPRRRHPEKLYQTPAGTRSKSAVGRHGIFWPPPRPPGQVGTERETCRKALRPPAAEKSKPGKKKTGTVQGAPLCRVLRLIVGIGTKEFQGGVEREKQSKP